LHDSAYLRWLLARFHRCAVLCWLLVALQFGVRKPADAILFTNERSADWDDYEDGDPDLGTATRDPELTARLRGAEHERKLILGPSGACFEFATPFGLFSFAFTCPFSPSCSCCVDWWQTWR
jgi:hypothetical protein